jgi:hypothetical protein
MVLMTSALNFDVGKYITICICTRAGRYLPAENQNAATRHGF